MAQRLFRRMLGLVPRLCRLRLIGRRRRAAPEKRGLRLEWLEDRRLLASFSDSGTQLNVSLAANENFGIVSSGSSYAFSSNQSLSNGGVTQSADFSVFGLTTITLLSSGLARYSTISIMDAASGSNAAVTFSSSGANAYSDNFSVVLDHALAGAITFNGSSSFSGSSTLSASTSKNIVVASGASISTVDGNLTLSANQQASATSGNFRGIDVNGGTVTTSGTGNISLTGRGGNDGATGQHFGVDIRGGSLVQSTAAALGAGTTTVTGQGGAGTTDNDGVVVESNSQIVSANGDVQITGTGGNGSTTFNRGVAIVGGGQIRSTGTGAIAANISVIGTGGTGTNSNIGVDLGTNTVVSAVDGDLTITGQASSLTSGSANYGVRLTTTAQVRSTGSGPSAGNITISGSGGGGTDTNQGVRLDGASVDIASIDGNVTIGGAGTATTGTFQDGVRLVNGAGLHLTGAGSLTITGTPGSTSGSVGVGLRLGGTSLSTIALAGSQHSLIGDRMVLDPALLAISAGAGTLTIRPKNSAVAVNLGSTGDSAANTLELSDAELDTITAQALSIGDTSSGTIVVSASLTQPGKNLSLTTAAGVSGAGDILNGSATATTLTITQAGNSSYSGRLGGPSGGTANDKNLAVTKRGAGTLTLSGVNSITGPTTIAAGALSVVSPGSISSSPTTVGAGATLKGTGTTDGVIVSSGGTVGPGLSPGRLNTGNVSFAGGAIFNVEVNGTTAGTTYDQLSVIGTVNLGGATLVTSGMISTPPGTDIVLISNDGTDAVMGTFASLPEGSLITINVTKFFLSYSGGDGNDVVLMSPDISLTSVQVIEPDASSTSATPVVGEQICVRANYTTRNLPTSASYRVEYVVDDIPVSVNLTLGAGRTGTTGWAWYRCGWFASPGSHTVQRVTLDADNAVTEVDETNNSLNPSIIFAPLAPSTLPQKFLNPMGGVMFRDWRFQNYYDVDPTSGIKDFQGGLYAYDGHNGHDINLPNFARMDAGIPEYAAADGTIETVADGNFDRDTVAIGQPANFVVINHGNGWRTEYYHLLANTITVNVGDTVTAGQLLGLAGSSGGSSGLSTGPHLHFGVTHNGALVESQYDPASFYARPLPYQASVPTSILDMGITNYSPTSADYRERPAEHSIFSTATPQNVQFWFEPSHFHAGDQYQVKWYRPDGTLNTTFPYTVPADERGPVHHWTLGSSALAGRPGTWRVAVEMGGVELGSRAFEVTTGAGAAGIKMVGQDGTVISDNRTTALDFGTATLGGATLSQIFTITNHGTAPLNPSGLVLPPGFAISGPFPDSIGPAATATFTVDLTTAQAGAKFGAIRFATNDPDTPSFNFNVSGTVSGAAPPGAPVISLPAPALAYTTLGQASVIDSTATVSDTDSLNFDGGSLTVEFNSISSMRDALRIRSVGMGPGEIGVSASSVSFGGTLIGTFSGGTNGVPLTINVNASATPVAVQELVRNVTFSTTATDPESLERYVRFTLVDDTGNTSNQPLAVVVQNLRPTTVSLEGGNLVIADSSAAGNDENLRLERSGSNLKLTDLTGNAIDVSSIPGSTGNATSIVTIPFTLFLDGSQIEVDSRKGIDSLTIDLSSGNPLPPAGISYSGGNPSVSPGDKLVIVGGDQGTVTYNYASAHDGSVAMSNVGTINYTGLEPIINSGAVNNVIFNLPPGPNVVTLGDDGITGNTLSRLSGATFEKTSFGNPSGSLMINRGNGLDTLTVNALPDFNASLTIGSPVSPFSSITFAGAVTLAAHKSLIANASGTISLPSSSIATSGTGSIRLTTTRNISVSAGSSISTVDGDITLAANQQASPTSGNFRGIDVNGGTLTTTGTGNINLAGRGGNDFATNLHIGVHVRNGGQLKSLSVGPSAGGITISGTGGVGTDTNQGVRIDGASVDVASIDGNVSITGAATATTGTFQDGVRLVNAAGVHVAGTGSLTITGTAGSTSSAVGVALRMAGTVLLSGASNNWIGDRILLENLALTAGTTTPAAKSITLSAGAGVTGTGEIINGSLVTMTVIIDQTGDSTFVGRLGGPSGGSANDKNLTFSKQGLGTLTLSGANTYTGPTSVTAGRLNVSGSITSDVTVASGATLGGTGTINSPATLTLESGGALSPGASPGVLSTGTLTLNPASTYCVELNGTTAGGGYDQTSVTGVVALTGARLDATVNFDSAIGDRFTIIDNDGIDAVDGTFEGLEEGAVFTPPGAPAGQLYQISYAAGTGNDVVMTHVEAPRVTPPADQTAVEGDLTSIELGSFDDPDAGPWTVDINWGDGRPHTVFSTSTVGALGRQNHVYAEERLQILTVTVTDSTNLSGSASFSISVTDATPMISADSASVTSNEGQAAANTGTFSDYDDVVTISASEGAVTQSGSTSGAWTWSQAYFEDGTRTITITAANADGSQSQTSFVVHVNNVAPTATNNAYSTPQAAVISGNVITDDTGGGVDDDPAGANDPLTISSHTDPANGTLVLSANGKFTYTPDSTFAGDDGFTYTINDGDGGYATATVTITVIAAAPGSILTIPDTRLGGTALLITGTAANDGIVVEPGFGSTLKVTFNGVSSTVAMPSGRIIVTGGDGDDNIQIAGAIANPVWLYGDAGNDWLNAGNGGGMLIGGNGNDELLGGGGRDVMIGGEGADKLVGNSGDDILIACFTTEDKRTAPAHEQFWVAVLAEWNSSNDFLRRVQNLRNGAGGNAHNGSSLLLPNVRDDVSADAIDYLIGASGNDWLLFRSGEDKVNGPAEAGN